MAASYIPAALFPRLEDGLHEGSILFQARTKGFLLPAAAPTQLQEEGVFRKPEIKHGLVMRDNMLAVWQAFCPVQLPLHRFHAVLAGDFRKVP